MASDVNQQLGVGVPGRAPAWKWYICTLLLLATVVNYMDRLTVNTLAQSIQTAFELNDEQYGDLELGFGLAFASGSLLFGFLVDKFGPYWLHPLVLIGWSAMGFLTGLSESYNELLTLRILLGLFEAGHFPCGLKTIQLLLEPRQRTLGNSLLQSGTALGAILASPAIGLLTGGDPMKWRTPFLVIGAGGCVWVLFWLMSIRPRDLRAAAEARAFSDVKITPDSLGPKQTFLQSILSWKFLALAVMVVCINLNWHLFRVWLPKFLQSARDYSFDDMLVFQTFYYVAADVGALTAGAVSGWLVHRGLTVYGGRMVVFAVCSALTTLASIAIFLPSGPLLLGTILLVGFGGLGCFTAFYSMTQDLSHEHQGKISGSLSTITWLTTAPFHKAFGRYLDQTHDYETVFATVGWLPMLSFVVTVLLWNRKRVT